MIGWALCAWKDKDKARTAALPHLGDDHQPRVNGHQRETLLQRILHVCVAAVVEPQSKQAENILHQGTMACWIGGTKLCARRVWRRDLWARLIRAACYSVAGMDVRVGVLVCQCVNLQTGQGRHCNCSTMQAS